MIELITAVNGNDSCYALSLMRDCKKLMIIMSVFFCFLGEVLDFHFSRHLYKGALSIIGFLLV